MRRLKSASVLLLVSLLPACSTGGAAIDPPQCKISSVCKRLELVRPSRKNDKISEPTARVIASNNVAVEEGCEAGK